MREGRLRGYLQIIAPCLVSGTPGTMTYQICQPSIIERKLTIPV